MNLSAVTGQCIMGTNWWTSVNSSAVDAPMKLIFFLFQAPQKQQKQEQKQKQLKQDIKEKKTSNTTKQ